MICHRKRQAGIVHVTREPLHDMCDERSLTFVRQSTRNCAVTGVAPMKPTISPAGRDSGPSGARNGRGCSWTCVIG